MWNLVWAERKATHFPRPTWVGDVKAHQGVARVDGLEPKVSGDRRHGTIGRLFPRRRIHPTCGRRVAIEVPQSVQAARKRVDEYGATIREQPWLSRHRVFIAARARWQQDGLKQREIGKPSELHGAALRLQVHVGGGRHHPIEGRNDDEAVPAPAGVDRQGGSVGVSHNPSV